MGRAKFFHLVPVKTWFFYNGIRWYKDHETGARDPDDAAYPFPEYAFVTPE